MVPSDPSHEYLHGVARHVEPLASENVTFWPATGFVGEYVNCAVGRALLGWSEARVSDCGAVFEYTTSTRKFCFPRDFFFGNVARRARA